MNEAQNNNQSEVFESVIKSLKDYAVFTTDRDAVITTWNLGAERILLYKAEDIIGRNGNILYTPEDIAAKVPELEISTAMNDGKAINERFHVKKDRSRFGAAALCTRFTILMANISALPRSCRTRPTRNRHRPTCARSGSWRKL